MTTAALAALIEQCRAGREAELVLLVRLQSLATRQRETTQRGDIDALQSASDLRETLTSEWVALERLVRPAHDRLTREAIAGGPLPGFDHAVGLGDSVARLVAEIAETDRQSIQALEQIVVVRRAAAHAAEQAESTMAAYSRTVAPRRTATLVDRRG